MAEDGSHPPEIAISRTSSASSKNKQNLQESQQQNAPSPKLYTNNKWTPHQWRTGKRPTWGSKFHDELEWHIKWTPECFKIGRVLIIDYLKNGPDATSPSSARRHVAVAAQEFQDIKDLEKFYSDRNRVHGAALRVIHVQNATWATRFLLRKFNIDHQSEIVGMQGFSKWPRYEKPRQRNGRPFPNGRSWREQTDPWRNVSRTAFGLDYLKTFETQAPSERRRRSVFGDKPIDAQMMVRLSGRRVVST